jgi:hypothetical protein
MPRNKWLVQATFSLFHTIVAAACQNQALPAAPASSLAPAAPRAPSHPLLTDLDSVEQLQTIFNEDAGRGC